MEPARGHAFVEELLRSMLAAREVVLGRGEARDIRTEEVEVRLDSELLLLLRVPEGNPVIPTVLRIGTSKISSAVMRPSFLLPESSCQYSE